MHARTIRYTCEVRAVVAIVLVVCGCERSPASPPRPPPPDPVSSPAVLVVNVSRDGDLAIVDGDAPVAVADDQLDARMQVVVTRDPATDLIVIADPLAMVDRVFTVLDRARLAGLRDFELGVERGRTHAFPAPKAATGDDTIEATAMVAVHPADDPHVNGESVPERGLDQALRDRGAPRTVVMTDAGVTMGRLINVLDAIKRAGVTRVALAKEPAR
jgi:biopolymer transport protein ExbD